MLESPRPEGVTDQGIGNKQRLGPFPPSGLFFLCTTQIAFSSVVRATFVSPVLTKYVPDLQNNQRGNSAWQDYSPIHDVYKDTNLSLLTDDLKDIKVVVNSYLVLGSYYGIRPRAEIEMPKLVAEAQELIAMLKEEYPD